MELEVVFLTFVKLSGLNVADASEYRFLCEAAVRYLKSRLKDDTDSGKYADSLNYAAAASAYYRYVLRKLSDEPSSELRVGEILSKRNTLDEIKAAELLCRQAFNDIGMLLKDDGFVFEAIK